VDTPDGELYYKVTISSWKKCNPSGLQQVVINDTFCGNNKRDIGKRIGEIVQR